MPRSRKHQNSRAQQPDTTLNRLLRSRSALQGRLARRQNIFRVTEHQLREDLSFFNHLLPNDTQIHECMFEKDIRKERQEQQPSIILAGDKLARCEIKILRYVVFTFPRQISFFLWHYWTPRTHSNCQDSRFVSIIAIGRVLPVELEEIIKSFLRPMEAWRS